jgi:hypothetical protein
METKMNGTPPAPSANDRQLHVFGGLCANGRHVEFGYTCGPVQTRVMIPVEAVDHLIRILVEARSFSGGLHVATPAG